MTTATITGESSTGDPGIGHFGSVIGFGKYSPTISDDAFIADGARIIGNVVIGAESSIWFNAVLRGDANAITIGARSNIQDGSVIHVNPGRYPAVIGDEVTVGHQVTLHGCELRDRCFVGIQSIVMDGCVIEEGAMLAAGSFLAAGKRIPAGELWRGSPAKPFRPLRERERKLVSMAAGQYVNLASTYRQGRGISPVAIAEDRRT